MKKPIWMTLGLTIIVVGTGFLWYMILGPGGKEPEKAVKPPDERAVARQLLHKWPGMDDAARTAGVPTLVKALQLDDEDIRLGVGAGDGQSCSGQRGTRLCRSLARP